MASGDPGEPREWVQLDPFGKLTGETFTGTFTDLRAHLTRAVPEGTVADPRVTGVYVRALVTKVTCPLVTLTTPWGSHRWIPAPARPPSRWSAWRRQR